VNLYQRVWSHTDATIEAPDLGAVGSVPRWQAEVPLFNVMAQCLSDTTRHVGHADILREGLDGAVGVDHDNPPRYGFNEAFWEARRATIERSASAADRQRST